MKAMMVKTQGNDCILLENGHMFFLDKDTYSMFMKDNTNFEDWESDVVVNATKFLNEPDAWDDEKFVVCVKSDNKFVYKHPSFNRFSSKYKK